VLRPAYYFRLTLPDRVLAIDGADLPPARRAELVARMPALDRGLSPRWYTSFMDTLGPVPEVVYLTVRHGEHGAATVYGFAVELPVIVETVLRPTLDQAPLLPGAARGRVSNDSLLSVSLVEPGGRRTISLSPRRLPATYAGDIPSSRFLGNWTLHLALDPVAAPDYLIGGLPPSRALPMALLALLTAVLVTTTVLAAWRAQELARLRTDFVASVSHELRTPLAQIQLFAESLALGRMRARPDVRGAGEVILGESRRLLQLVENVLLFGRGVRMVPAPPYPPLRLAPLVRETVERFAPVAASARARVRTVRLEDVSAPAEPGAVRQVLVNLLDNAAKYGPPGQTISVGLAAVDGRARVWVADDGPGIPAQERERVFEPFVRLPRDVSSSIAGSGIGFALVRELVVLHRGRAHIEESPTGGACVVIELPDAQTAEQPCAC
jgi:signal transduction histidine kinase